MLKFFSKGSEKSNPLVATALQKGAIVLDVRTPSEFHSGHVSGSRNIPLDEIRSQVEMIRQWNKPVITVCRSGNRSQRAMEILTSCGVEAYNGGGWESLPE